MAIKVLIIEDNQGAQLLLESICDFFDISQKSVDSIVNAKKFLDYSIPKLIILDNQLPDGTGVEFIDFLKEKYPCIGIILYTGDSIDIDQKGLREKILLYVEKPAIQPIFKLIENMKDRMECDRPHKCFSQECNYLQKLI